jgi:hypothetical protein
MENKYVAVDKMKLYNYLKGQDLNTLSNKELVVSMHGITMMEDHHNFLVGINTGLTATSIVCGLIVSSPALLGFIAGTGMAGAYFTIFNTVRAHQIKKLQNKYADALLNRYQSTLLSLDTLSNQKYLTKKRINSLKEEKNRLDNIKLRKEKLDKKINALQNVYLVISKNIKEMDEYLEQIKKRIASFKHQQFLRFDEQFQKDIAVCKNQIKQQQMLIENLQEERTYILFDPTDEKIRNIDNQIRQEDLNLNVLIKNLNELEHDYETFLNQNENNTIKKLLEIGNFYEQNLPKIKDLILELKEKINNKTEKSLALQNELADYQNILIQIQELENEDFD